MPVSAFRILSPLLSARPLWLALLSLALHATASAQTPGDNSQLADTVSWTVSVESAGSVKQGTPLALELHGDVLDGWHVYGLEQLPRGPIPLRVTLDANDIAVSEGALAATAPTKSHDPSFNLNTQYYAKDFTLTMPVRVKPQAAPGPQQIPVSVRFQTCNGQTCRPPKTVHLLAPVNVQTGG